MPTVQGGTSRLEKATRESGGGVGTGTGAGNGRVKRDSESGSERLLDVPK